MNKDFWKDIISVRLVTKSGQVIPGAIINKKLWHNVNISIDGEQHRNDILEWIEECETPCVICNHGDDSATFYFIEVEDITAFKLRWI